MINLFSEGIDHFLWGDRPLFQKLFKDFISPAFKIFLRFFVEITMFTDQIDQRPFVQFHWIASTVECNLKRQMNQGIPEGKKFWEKGALDPMKGVDGARGLNL
jgi:hypothetical protein